MSHIIRSYVATYILSRKSRLTVVSRTAILIERSPIVYCKKLPYEKTMHVTKTTYNHLVFKINT